MLSDETKRETREAIIVWTVVISAVAAFIMLANAYPQIGRFMRDYWGTIVVIPAMAVACWVAFLGIRDFFFPPHD